MTRSSVGSLLPRCVDKTEPRIDVDTIMELLDLEPLQDAIIGTPEAGLTVEQRKRVTIGVELAAKPRCVAPPTCMLYC